MAQTFGEKFPKFLSSNQLLVGVIREDHLNHVWGYDSILHKTLTGHEQTNYNQQLTQQQLT